MSTELTVRQNLLINAPVARVWDVLVQPRYINQWNELPGDFNYGAPLQLGTEILWVHPSGNRTTLTVISFRQGKELRLSLNNSHWTIAPRPDEVAYTYTLSEQGGATGLAITIGDFSRIPGGDKFYEASLEFAREGGKKIKALAEQAGTSRGA